MAARVAWWAPWIAGNLVQIGARARRGEWRIPVARWQSRCVVVTRCDGVLCWAKRGQEATVRVHQLCADSKTAKRKATKWPKEEAAAFAEPPAYAKQKERALQFIYDDEVRCGSRFVNDDAMLKWAPL